MLYKLPISIAKKVERRVLNCEDPRTVWTAGSFPGLPARKVTRALSRLAAKRTIKRVRKGIYYRPIETLLGPSIPDPIAVAEAAAEIKGRNVVIGGYTAYNALGLTTQVASKTTLLSDKPTDSTALNNNRVRTLSRPVYPKMTPSERAVLDALRDINRISDTTPTEILVRIIRLIRSGKLSFEKLARFALRGEPPRVRKLLGIIGASVGAPERILRLLGHSLNSITTFNIHLDDSSLKKEYERMTG